MADRLSSGSSQNNDRPRRRRPQGARSGEGGSRGQGASSGTHAAGMPRGQRPTKRTTAGARATASSSRRTAAGAGRTSARAGAAGRSGARTGTRRASSARSRKRSRRGVATSSADRTTLIVGIAALVLGVLLLFFAVRGIAGCVSRAFSPRTDTASEQSAQPAQEEVTEAKADPVQINLVMIGDILQHSGVFQSGYLDDGTRNYDHVFAHIAGELEGADIKVVNQETLLGGETLGFTGYPAFNGPQEMGDAEVKAGFNVVLRATNHALDYGYEGLHNELSFWATAHPEVAVLGARDPDDSTSTLDDPYIFEKDGFKVALLNYTYGTNDIPDPDGAVSLLEEERVRETVSAAKAEADMVVVFPHWGEEYCLEPIQDQYDMAQVFMDAGADVIIGGHPHVIEPVEVLTASDGRKVPCFWSVGNFISTQVDNQNLIGGVAKVTMVKDADGNCSVTSAAFDATVTHKGLGTDMTTYLLTDYTDDLASTNYLALNDTDNTSLTVAWANDFCTQVLGAGFDSATGSISFGPEAFEPAQPADAAATSTDADGTDDATATTDDAAETEEEQDLAA